ncbi:MAG: choice-of-anchor X domain-containing protein, partial [Rubrivivax sp.]|nr:choice-of-anchor X domain-containing protein [Rubrivivax sp.]
MTAFTQTTNGGCKDRTKRDVQRAAPFIGTGTNEGGAEMKKPNNERAEARLPWGAFAVRNAIPAAWPRRALGALALLAGLVASGNAAAGAIGVLQGSPLVVSAGNATAVTFSVSITDTNYREGSGNIQRMKADGSVLSVVGNLRDDGLQGDAVAGDRIYSLRVNLQEAAAGSVSFRASAAYRNEIKRTFSNLVTLTVNPAGPAPVIDAAALSPAGTTAGLALVSTVTATIANEQLIAGSAVLQKLAADGSVLGNVGSLRDDGQEGDVSAGDRTYTLRTTV